MLHLKCTWGTLLYSAMHNTAHIICLIHENQGHAMEVSMLNGAEGTPTYHVTGFPPITVP